VEFSKDDIERLWKELIEKFEPPPPGLEKRSVSGTIAAESRGERVEETDIERFLHSELLADVLDDLTVHLHADYGAPGERFERLANSRRLLLSIDDFLGVDVRLTGDKEWILGMKAFLDSFFGKRIRRVLSLRITMVLVLSVAPAAAFFSAGSRINSDPLEIFSIFWANGAIIGFSLLSGKWYPKSLLVIDERGLRKPWYVEWAKVILGSVLLTAISTIVLSFFWPS